MSHTSTTSTLVIIHEHHIFTFGKKELLSVRVIKGCEVTHLPSLMCVDEEKGKRYWFNLPEFNKTNAHRK